MDNAPDAESELVDLASFVVGAHSTFERGFDGGDATACGTSSGDI
jgi:hypothetical protein